ncbi:hypothetical protein FP026_12075 [Rhizobium tropici]|uniref:Uncharacterized protein n=1 Tax=Rhizobium tropici TaxID=398 RepID=A0A5B0W706_RHITR|nr:hypothetical protein [Rhizobium tropici]KAA1182793.1 hypothetical protein FP026_12075 [Rhizobium tropici]
MREVSETGQATVSIFDPKKYRKEIAVMLGAPLHISPGSAGTSKAADFQEANAFPASIAQMEV